MKQELLQMIQHEDERNVILGCIIAYHDGVDLVELFNKLKPIHNRGELIIWEVNGLRFQYYERFAGNYFAVISIFRKDLSGLTFTETINGSDDSLQILKQYQRTFMEYVVGLKH